MSRYPKGFTLIELIVIIVIVGLLGATAIVKYTSMTANAERAKCRVGYRQPPIGS